MFEDMAKKEGISLAAYKDTKVPRFFYTKNEHAYNSSTQRYETQDYFLENGEKEQSLAGLRQVEKKKKKDLEPQGEVF